MVKPPIKVRHVIDYLEKFYEGLIDLSDLGLRADSSEQEFRTRALTALVLQDLTGCDAEEAAAGVVDGFNDHGLTELPSI